MNLEELNEKIEFVLQHIQRKERIQKHILRNVALLDGMRMDLKALEKSLLKEERDVLILENQNVQSLFLKVLGNREKQLEIERQEYLMELLKYNELVDSISVKEYEISVLENLLVLLKQETSSFDALLKKKASFIEQDKRIAIKIKLKDQIIETTIKRIQAIDDAIVEGKAAQKLLQEIKLELQKVTDWGTWQYYGSGNNSAYAKKSFIDRARKKAIGVSAVIENFENDLHGIFKDLDIPNHFRLDHFEQFLNVFYENLITDWIIQKNIKNAVQNIQMTKDKISRLIATVESRKRKITATLDLERQARKEIILKN